MIQRDSLSQIMQLLREFPAVAVLGARQVGKTTLAARVVAGTRKKVVHLDLEKASDRRQLDDPEIFFEANRDRLVVLDEIQVMPHLFTALRPEIDALRRPARFVLTGSASPELVKGVSESLAGRIYYTELPPLTLPEAARARYSLQRHWFRGGFPPALTAKSDAAFHRWADSFIRSYVERDLSLLFGVSLPPVAVRNFWEMLANATGTVLNIEHYARALGVSGPTIKRYIDFLEGAFLVRRLQPWFANTGKRIVKAPKIYVRDSGIVHALCGVATPADLPGHNVVGGSWEGYVVEQIASCLPRHVRPFYYRTQHGAEADLVLVSGMKPVACIEIKHSSAPVPSAGFYNCIADLETTSNWVIYPGRNTYRGKGNVEYTPLPALLQRLKRLPVTRAAPGKGRRNTAR